MKTINRVLSKIEKMPVHALLMLSCLIGFAAGVCVGLIEQHPVDVIHATVIVIGTGILFLLLLLCKAFIPIFRRWQARRHEQEQEQ